MVTAHGCKSYVKVKHLSTDTEDGQTSKLSAKALARLGIED